ncbi:MAG: RNA-binding protein [Dictyoglomus sp. NZ13-RE01]|nr:MAG: RNA-binding protein [Dictyoglomus sp. NZ13-RE01]
MPRSIEDLEELFKKVDQKGGLIVTDFLSPEDYHYFQELSYKYSNLFVLLFGGYDLAERRRGFISDSKELLEYIDFDKYFSAFEISFPQKQTPKGFKEELIKIGIDEGKLGDIWEIGENRIQFISAKEIEVRLIDIFNSSNIAYFSLTLDSLSPPKRAKMLKTTEASLRLDAITSFALNIPRSRVQQIIKNGAVTVNNKKVDYPHYEIKEGDIVFVRSYGYFKVISITETKRGRYLIEIERH